MKITDLFMNYCEIDGIQIVSILNHKIFFAITNSGKVRSRIPALLETNIAERYLKEGRITKQQKNNDITYFWIKEKLPQSTPVARFLEKSELDILQNTHNNISVDYLYDKTWLTFENISELYLFNKYIDMAIYDCQENIGNKNKQDPSQDDTKVIQWFKNNIRDEEPVVMCNLGMLYADGRGVPKDNIQAASLYKKAAQRNCVVAMGLLSSMFENGRGVEHNPQNAAYWQKKVINSDDLLAEFFLGRYHAKGLGVTQDDTMAMYWYKQAARKGNKQAMYAISLLYKYGRGITKSWFMEKYWLIKSGRLFRGKVDDLAKQRRSSLNIMKNIPS